MDKRFRELQKASAIEVMVEVEAWFDEFRPILQLCCTKLEQERKRLKAA